MNILLEKFKEVLFSVAPISVLVIIMNFTLTPMPLVSFMRFLLGAVFVVLGLSVFLLGVDIGISPLGNHIGSALSKTNKIQKIILGGLVLGFFISIAEPDLQILAGQVASVTGEQFYRMAILIVVSVGIAVMLVIGLSRIVYNFSLKKLLAILYGIIFILSFFVTPEFLAIGFDASGATTGALTVPFILALAVGVSTLKKNSERSESDSFGLVAITSTGAIIGVLLMNIFSRSGGLTGGVENHLHDNATFLSPFLDLLPTMAFESFLAILPLAAIYVFFQIKMFKFGKRQFKRILKGLSYTFVGLIIFLTGVNAGFMDAGNMVGAKIAEYHYAYVLVVGFILGFVTILAEPAVYVLTKQIETVTSGYVKRSLVLMSLSIGVGIAVLLSVIRIIVPSIELWHFLLPGYIISIGLMAFVPNLFVGIAFDSGGVASGPMTATFILAFVQGVASTVAGADVLKDAFGMIALVAMMPLIALQLLGLIFEMKKKKKVKLLVANQKETGVVK